MCKSTHMLALQFQPTSLLPSFIDISHYSKLGSTLMVEEAARIHQSKTKLSRNLMQTPSNRKSQQSFPIFLYPWSK